MIERVKISGYRILRRMSFYPRPGINILVGDNDAGKTTLLQAITLALTGRVNGRPAAEDLNPYWFNQDDVAEFFVARGKGKPVAPPEIDIEVFLQDRDEFQRWLFGAHNSEVPVRECAGIRLRIAPSPEYSEEIEAYFATGKASLLPVEYYTVDWRSFGDIPLTRRPKELTTAIIDSRTISSTSGIDFHLRSILNDALTDQDRANLSLAFRGAKEQLTAEHLACVNRQVGAVDSAIGDKPLSLAMDQSARSSWETSIVPHVADIPFAMAGQGQQAIIKTVLAMGGGFAQASKVVMIEEPDNHLSHSNLNRLLGFVKDSARHEQQLLVTTHSSFVLNRLGLDSLAMVHQGSVSTFETLTEDTVRYFQKLPGFDTLRAALSDRVVLVEGPSDEILFNSFYKAARRHVPLQDGIDVISMNGLSLERGLELSKVLGKRCAVLRDNDGVDPDDILTQLRADLLDPGSRRVFIGRRDKGRTLELQLIEGNSEAVLRSALGIREKTNLASWMANNKTESALRLAESGVSLVPPAYFAEAIEFISAQ